MVQVASSFIYKELKKGREKGSLQEVWTNYLNTKENQVERGLHRLYSKIKSFKNAYFKIVSFVSMFPTGVIYAIFVFLNKNF